MLRLSLRSVFAVVAAMCFALAVHAGFEDNAVGVTGPVIAPGIGMIEESSLEYWPLYYPADEDPPQIWWWATWDGQTGETPKGTGDGWKTYLSAEAHQTVKQHAVGTVKVAGPKVLMASAKPARFAIREGLTEAVWQQHHYGFTLQERLGRSWLGALKPRLYRIGGAGTALEVALTLVVGTRVAGPSGKIGQGPWPDVRQAFIDENGASGGPPCDLEERWPRELVSIHFNDQFSETFQMEMENIGKHRLELHLAVTEEFTNCPTQDLELCCGAIRRGDRMVKRGEKEIWAYGVKVLEPPTTVAGPAVGTGASVEEVRPSGTAQASASEARVRVYTENPAPNFPVYVAFIAKRLAQSGGHEARHHAPTPNTFSDTDLIDTPAGAFQQMFMTIPAGQLSIDNTYTASEFGGTEVIRVYASDAPWQAEAVYGATPTSANRDTAVAMVEKEAEDSGLSSLDTPLRVRVPDLVLLPPPATDSGYVRIGGTDTHHGPGAGGASATPDNNHWGTQEMIQTIQEIGKNFKDTGQVRVNDISLPWGGRFDVSGKWNRSKGHTHTMGHSVGRGVDISTMYVSRANRPVRDKKQVYPALKASQLTESTNTSVFQPNEFILEGKNTANEHYHVMK